AEVRVPSRIPWRERDDFLEGRFRRRELSRLEIRETERLGLKQLFGADFLLLAGGSDEDECRGAGEEYTHHRKLRLLGSRAMARKLARMRRSLLVLFAAVGCDPRGPAPRSPRPGSIAGAVAVDTVAKGLANPW